MTREEKRALILRMLENCEWFEADVARMELHVSQKEFRELQVINEVNKACKLNK